MMKTLAPDRIARLATLGVALFAAGVARSGDVGPTPASGGADVREADLQQSVIAPLRKQLDEQNAEGRKHADTVDHGEVHIIRPKITKEGFEKPSGWVIRVVRPFENDYFTSSYTIFEMTGWEWTDPHTKQAALVAYDETLFVKNADSVEALKKEPWLKMTTIPHRLRAERAGSSWQVIEVPSEASREDVHKPVWMH